MATRTHRTVPLGDVVLAIFDEAARVSADPREVADLATAAVRRTLRRAARTSTADRVATADDWLLHCATLLFDDRHPTSRWSEPRLASRAPAGTL